MKGFIEVNKLCNNGKKSRMAIAVSTILAVYEEDDGTAFIETQTRKLSPCGAFTTESYSEVMEKISDATK